MAIEAPSRQSDDRSEDRIRFLERELSTAFDRISQLTLERDAAMAGVLAANLEQLASSVCEAATGKPELYESLGKQDRERWQKAALRVGQRYRPYTPYFQARLAACYAEAQAACEQVMTAHAQDHSACAAITACIDRIGQLVADPQRDLLSVIARRAANVASLAHLAAVVETVHDMVARLHKPGGEPHPALRALIDLGNLVVRRAKTIVQEDEQLDATTDAAFFQEQPVRKS